MSLVSGVSGEIKGSAIGLVESEPPVLEGRGCGLACRDGGQRGEAAIRNFTSFVGGLKVFAVGLPPVSDLHWGRASHCGRLQSFSHRHCPRIDAR